VSNRAALYIVATPIGNLEDLTPRAQRVLAGVALIAAEDTRHSGKLLQHFHISTPVIALHEHNEREQVPALIERLRRGESLALLSDAGTPLVSDPGYHLVRAAHAASQRVIPLPGACAAVAALSAAGLPTDRFAFEGFPPAKAAARRHYYEALRADPRTQVFYESPHRILESLTDLADVFGAGREATVARELTKQFETIRTGRLGELVEWMRADEHQQLGEFVLIVHGADVAAAGAGSAAEGERILKVLLEELPLKQAVSLASRLSGEPRNRLYDLALAMQKGPSGPGGSPPGPVE
jgi:16S rRNA (cytidine1402-2'-O)-methyltransferase